MQSNLARGRRLVTPRGCEWIRPTLTPSNNGVCRIQQRGMPGGLTAWSSDRSEWEKFDIKCRIL